MRVPLINLFISGELFNLQSHVDNYFRNRVSEGFYFENRIFFKKDERYFFGVGGTITSFKKEEFFQKFKDFYASKVNIDSDVNFLQVNIYLSLSDKEAIKNLKSILDCISEFREIYHLDLKVLVFSLGENFNSILDENKISSENDLKVQSENCEGVMLARDQINFIPIFFENKNLLGLNIEFSQENLIRLIFEMSIRIVYNYSDITNLLASGKIYSFGCSSYFFEVQELREHLQKIAALHVFNFASIGKNKEVNVDNVKIGEIVAEICRKNIDLYPLFIEWAQANNYDPSQNKTTNVSTFMKTENSVFLEFLKEPNLSIIEKKAIFNQLLGEDDDSVIGYNFNNYERYTLQDIEFETANFFIKELKEPITLYEIKQLRQTIQNQKNFKKQKESELNELERYIPKTSDSLSKQLVASKISYGRKKFELSKKEVPFINEGSYAYFTINDQVTSRSSLEFCSYLPDFLEVIEMPNEIICFGFLYSYYLRRNGDLESLSLEFLLSRLRDSYGEKEEYSLLEIINVLKTKGISKRQFYSDLKNEPSSEAVEDGLSRRLDNVLKLKPEKSDFLNALNQGHPIYIKIRVFSDFINHFESSHGVIQFPREEEINSNKEFFHPIVICGFTKVDDNFVFIGKSPWGKEFGSDGFVYLSEDYLFSATFLNECFVIGKIEGLDTSLGYKVDFNALNFNLQDDTSMANLVLSSINFSRYFISRLENEYREKMDLYSKEIQRLLNPNSRYRITQIVAQRISNKIENLEKQLAGLKKEFEEAKLANEKRLGKKNLFKWLAIGGGFVAGIFLLLNISIFPTIIGAILSLVSLYLLKNLGPDNDLDQLSKKIKLLEDEISILKVQLENIYDEGELRGYLLDEFHKLKSNLKDKYHLFADFINELSDFFTELKDYEQKALNPSGPFQSLVDFEFLKNNTHDRIAKSYQSIKLFDLIDLNKANTVLEAKKEMLSNISNKNELEFKDVLVGFEMEKYLSNEKQYSYLPPPETLDIYANRLQKYSRPFVFLNNTKIGGNNLTSRLCFIPKVENSNLSTGLQNHFDFPPIFKEFGYNFQSIAHFQLLEIPSISNLVISSQSYNGD